MVAEPDTGGIKSMIEAKDVRQNDGLIKVRRDNVILRIEPEQKAYYMGLGYNVVDNAGKVVEETIPTDIASLQRFYKDAKSQIDTLKSRIEELEEENARLKKAKPAKKEVVVAEPEPFVEEDIENVEPETVAPKRRRKSR